MAGDIGGGAPERNAAALERVAAALERLAGSGAEADPADGAAFMWDGRLRAVAAAPAPPLALLRGVDAQKAALAENTRRHGAGLPAHDALLWGARGMGKSALARAAVAAVPGVALVGVARDGVALLHALFARLAGAGRRFVVLADDLAFEAAGKARALRSVLEGGVEARPENVRLYVTSNRRHLAPRELAENDPASPRDALDDKLALADRFGLSLGFHPADQETYLAIARAYAEAFGLAHDEAGALGWARARGARSGRVAWQWTQELAGRRGVRLDMARADG